MGKLFNGLVKIAAVVGIAAAVKKLSEKKNRDAVKEEYYKAKANPKAYAENLQGKVTDKAQEYQEKAKSEYTKAKDDPKAYAGNVQSKVTEQAKDVQSKVTEQAKHYQEVAKDEFGKAKEDPKSYAKNVRDQAKEKTDEVAELAQKNIDKIKEGVSKDKHTVSPDSDSAAESDEEKFQSEGNVHPDEVVEAEIDKTEAQAKQNNIHVVKKDDKK